MKVILQKDWIGKPAGSQIELADAKAKRLIKTGFVKKVKVSKRKSKERTNERTQKTSRK